MNHHAAGSLYESMAGLACSTPVVSQTCGTTNVLRNAGPEAASEDRTSSAHMSPSVNNPLLAVGRRALLAASLAPAPLLGGNALPIAVIIATVLLTAVLLGCVTRRKSSSHNGSTAGSRVTSRSLHRIDPALAASASTAELAGHTGRSSPALSGALQLSPVKSTSDLVAFAVAGSPSGSDTATVRLGQRQRSSSGSGLRALFRLTDEGITVRHLLRQRPGSRVYYGAPAMITLVGV